MLKICNSPKKKNLTLLLQVIVRMLPISLATFKDRMSTAFFLQGTNEKLIFKNNSHLREELLKNSQSGEET